MEQLTPDDQMGVRKTYDMLSALLKDLRVALMLEEDGGQGSSVPRRDSHEKFDPGAAELSAAQAVLMRLREHGDWHLLAGVVRQLGRGIATGHAHAIALREALHDIRGGALTALILGVDLLQAGTTDDTDVLRAFYLTRDHLKIMRNALTDLDPAGRARDLSLCLHGTGLLVQKWQDVTHRVATKAAHVDVSCNYFGPVSQRCLEFAAVDRVLYNLMNNGVRFSSDGRVRMDITRIGGDVRFVVANRIAPAHQVVLGRQFETTLGKLFAGGFTVDGAGLGLRICADFVTNAYGLNSVEEAVELRHIGAMAAEEEFVTWFHWPAA